MIRRPGYTLIEILIATALGGLVLGLAIDALMQLNKASSLGRSKQEAQTQVSLGIAKLGPLLRGASFYFYDARPLVLQTAQVSGKAAQPAPRDASVPPTVAAATGTGVGRTPPTLLLQVNKTKWIGTTPLASFRFPMPEDNAPAGLQLRCANGRVTGDPVKDVFPGPLAYFAQANFAPTLAGVAQNPYALLPISWNFYVIYLAPMNLPDTDANVAEMAPLDDFSPPFANGAPHRTAVPLQLRMLQIPGVAAGPLAPVSQALPSGDIVAYDATVQRALAPGPAVQFLDPPYDYVGMVPADSPNYDPIRVSMDAGLGGFMSAATGAPYQYTSPTSNTPQSRPASGPRIVGAPVHANFNMIGNDPPTDTALLVRVPGAPPATDTLVANYIDPDSVSGTGLRFLNNMRQPPAGTADPNGNINMPAGNPYQRYLPMYGAAGGYLENRYMDEWSDTTSDTTTGSYGVLPRRAQVTLTVRYRTRKDIPFQFATESHELDLDGVAAFEQVRARGR